MAAILSGGGGSWVKTYRLPEKFIKWQQDVSYRANIGMPGDDISQFREYVISPIDNFASKGSRLMDERKNLQDGAPSQSGCWELQLNLGFLPFPVEYYDFLGHVVPCEW